MSARRVRSYKLRSPGLPAKLTDDLSGACHGETGRRRVHEKFESEREIHMTF
jgi:hypothetical protein